MSEWGSFHKNLLCPLPCKLYGLQAINVWKTFFQSKHFLHFGCLSVHPEQLPQIESV